MPCPTARAIWRGRKLELAPGDVNLDDDKTLYASNFNFMTFLSFFNNPIAKMVFFVDLDSQPEPLELIKGRDHVPRLGNKGDGLALANGTSPGATSLTEKSTANAPRNTNIRMGIVRALGCYPYVFQSPFPSSLPLGIKVLS